MSAKPDNPFKGLESYRRADYPNLYGRDGDFVFMKDRIFSGRTTLMFAASGVGKTSFFAAKLIPELEQRHRLPLTIVYHRQWSAGDPLAAVRRTLQAGAEEPLTAFFQRNPGQWIVVLDQFEELFQNPDYWTTSEALRAEIAAVVRSTLPVRIVFSMREEFLGQLSFFDNQIPDVFRNYYRLKNPDTATAAEIILGICGKAAVDPDGLALLVRDLTRVEIPTAGGAPRYVSLDAVFLPYLQLVCRALWEAQPEIANQPFQFLAGYAEGRRTDDGLSPPARILEECCVAELGRLSKPQRSIASRALDYLVVSQGAKRAYTSIDLAAHMRLRKRALLEQTLAALAGSGILRAWQRGDQHWFELAHDMYAPILYRWKERFQAARRRHARRLVGGTVMLAVGALLGMYWWSHSQAHKTLAESLDQRAESMELQQDRDSALMLRLRALDADPTAARRRAAASDAFPPEQLLYTLLHDAPVTAMAFSPDGKYVVTAAGAAGAAADPAAPDGGRDSTQQKTQSTAQVWDAKNGKPEGDPWNLPGTVTYIALAPSRHVLATAVTSGRYPDVSTTISIHGREGTEAPARVTLNCGLDQMRFDDTSARLLVACRPGPSTEWSVFDAQLKAVVEPRRAAQIMFSPNGRMAVAETASGELERWDLETGKLVGKVNPGAWISWLAFAPNNKSLAAADSNGGIVLYDAATGEKLDELPSAGSDVRFLAFSPDGQTLLGVRFNGSIPDSFTRWDVRTRQQSNVPLTGAGALSYWFPVPDQGVVVERHGARLWLWDSATGAPLRHAAAAAWVRQHLLSPDGRQLLTWEQGGAVHAWDTSKGARYDGIQRALAAALDQNGETAAILQSFSGPLRVRSLRAGGEGRTFTLGFGATAVVIAPKGDFAGAAGGDRVQVWNTQDGTALPVAALPHEEGGYRFWLREDGAVVARSLHSLLVIPRGATAPRPVPGIGALAPGKDQVAVSAWGTWVARVQDGLTVWDTRSGTERVFPDVRGTPAFTVDGRFLLVTSPGNPVVLELSTGNRLNVPHAGANLVAVNPDGTVAVSSGLNPELRAWNPKTGEAFTGNTALATSAGSIAISPDASLFARTAWWAYWFPLPGKGIGHICRPMPAPWDYDLAMAGTGATIRTLLSVHDGWIVPEEFDSNLSRIPPLRGKLDDWEKKLNLKLADSELKPQHQVHVARAEAGTAAPKR